jgi:tetratricopeptide (TPR) repeat protein
MREYALSWLVQTLAEVGKWAQAEQVIADIRKDEPRARALTLLGLALAREGQGEWAWKIVREAESVVAGMQAGSWEKNDALKSLGEALARLQRWEEAEKAMRAIQRHREKVDALSLLGLLLARGHQQENALRLWNEVEVLIEGMYSERDWKLQILATSLAQAQQFQAAERVIAKIKQNDAKSRALSTLGQELAQTRQLAGAKKAWEEAEQLIAGDGSYALAALGDAFMQGNQLLDAERVLEKIKEKRPKCIALSKLAVAFLQSGQKPRATQILNAIERSIIGAQDDFKYEREIEFFREFGVRMANVKQMEHALEIWQKTEQIIRAMEENEPSRKQDSLARLRLVQSLAQAQQWEQARQVISGFEDMWLKVRGLKELKDVWLQERQIDQARAVWEEIKQVMPTIQDELDRQRLADILMEMQEWDEAEQVIRGLPEGDLTTNQETKLVRELAQAQRWEQAKAFVVSIQDSWTRSVVQAELGMVFTQAQRWDEAEQIIQSIRHLHWILKAWKEWGKALTQAGMVERAQRAWDEMRWQIRFIEWEREKAERLIELGQTLIEVHQWEKSQTIWDMAEQTITTIEGSNERIMKLLELGRVLAHAQQWERMQRVCDAMEREIEPLAADIRDAWERDRYLGYLAEILVLAQRWEEAERVIARTQDIDEDERKEALKIENEKVLLEAEREGVTKILYSSENPRTTALARLGVALSQATNGKKPGV